MTEEAQLTSDQIDDLRIKTEDAFKELKEKSEAATPSTSWIRSGDDAASDAATTRESTQNGATATAWDKDRSPRCQFFDHFGFTHVGNFCDEDEVRRLKEQMAELANNDWQCNDKVASFGTDAKANKARGDYFLDSSNQIHYFAEPTALDEDGNLKSDFANDKLAALNKSGHAMHIRDGAFRDYTLSQKVRDLVTDLGWEDPVVPQSMYIFKQPRIGGTVHSHQDSTFLHTTPKQSCLGLWLALDDATLENGCLWVRPGSHKEPLRRQFIRNPEYFEEGKMDASKLTFLQHHENDSVTWEGGLPKDQSLWEAGFIPVECKAGDLLAFCGTLDHLSLPNFSDRQRHTFQLHLIEGPRAGVTWSPQNWLQYPLQQPFISLLRDT
eukprot:CAMPEP_0198124944 /NCGR_PEP_ID=MMETSP1442-20131203/41377_1 /TAXON_ID= /ORGANISM="Craspedostauros australis, Strain CCMP3328" /LENGTH=381 /DNA_ID=CAMNT_0043784459 /DNA_START=39 /DNA_END=1184 /DNA_ORIENTATION=+